MTRERLSRELMNHDLRTNVITLAEHSSTMNAQQTSLLSTVEVARRHLINNLTQKTIDNPFSCDPHQ